MALQITIAQSGKPVTVAGQAREDLDLGTAVTLTASGASGPLTWSLHDVPLSADCTAISGATLSSSSSNPVSITPDYDGTYFVKCAAGSETVGITFYAGVALSAIASNTPRRIPAFDEELEHTVHDAPQPSGNTKGWSRELARWLSVIRKLDQSAALAVSFPALGSAQYPGLTTSHIAYARGPTLPAGGYHTLIDIDGAGYFNKISMTFNSSNQNVREDSRLQIFVDGEDSPSVDVAFKDLCCCRGASGNFNSANIQSDRFGAQSTAFTIGTSFYFNLAAPFSSHLKVLIVNGSATNTGLLGGWAEYKLGTTLNWGKYGKLHAISLPGNSIAPYAGYTICDLSLTNGGMFAGMYLHFQGGDGNYQYMEGEFDLYIDSPSTITTKYDSTEDYFSSGFYFWGGTFLTRELGATYKDNAATLGAYRFHDTDPIVFDSTFKMVWFNGVDGSLPTLTNTTVRGVIWYYESTAAGAVSPTLKGDQGVPGTPGAAGAPGTGSIQVVEPLAAARSPILLLTGNQTLNDDSGNGYNMTLANGTTRYSQLMPNSPLYGLLCEGLSGSPGTYYHRNTRTAALDLTGDMTVEFFLYVHAITASGIWLVSYGASGEDLATNDLWGVNIVPIGGLAGMPFGFNLFWEHDAGVNVTCTGTKPCPVGQLVHFAFKRSGTSAMTYLDGILLETFTGLTAPNFSGPTQTLKIGASSGGATVAGGASMIGGFQVIGSALSDAQILADAKAQMLWL